MVAESHLKMAGLLMGPELHMLITFGPTFGPESFDAIWHKVLEESLLLVDCFDSSRAVKKCPHHPPNFWENRHTLWWVKCCWGMAIQGRPGDPTGGGQPGLRKHLLRVQGSMLCPYSKSHLLRCIFPPWIHVLLESADMLNPKLAMRKNSLQTSKLCECSSQMRRQEDWCKRHQSAVKMLWLPASQDIADGGCSRWTWPPAWNTKIKHWIHLESKVWLSWTFKRSDGVMPGTPFKWSGVRTGGGPPLRNLSREYWPQLGLAPAYATVPLAHNLRSCSYSTSSSKSICDCTRISNESTHLPRLRQALDKGRVAPAHISRKIRWGPKVCAVLVAVVPAKCGIDGTVSSGEGVIPVGDGSDLPAPSSIEFVICNETFQLEETSTVALGVASMSTSALFCSLSGDVSQCGTCLCSIAPWLPPQACPAGVGYAHWWLNLQSDNLHLPSWNRMHSGLVEPSAFLVSVTHCGLPFCFPLPLDWVCLPLPFWDPDTWSGEDEEGQGCGLGILGRSCNKPAISCRTWVNSWSASSMFQSRSLINSDIVAQIWRSAA